MVFPFEHYIPSLSLCPLFQNVALDKLPVLLNSVRAEVEEYPAGTMVRHQGDRYEGLIIVAEGILETRIDDGSGRGMMVEYFRPVSMVASAVLVSSNPVLPVSLIARKDVTLISFKRDELFSLFSREPAVLKAYMADAGDKVRFLTKKLRLLRFGTLRQRIADHLLSLALEQETDRPRWRHGREQMADLLGVARPSLSRELSMMSQEGLIQKMNRSHVGLCVSRLENLLEERPAPGQILPSGLEVN
ncbi:MAG: hypothetical protein DRZ90_09790 [Spirochaetes bacterium]|nr:MAG: hypothetical protein DRP60_02130 [Spirochaetota bacterium]RKX95770.1 MAG: hypothetical protein DRZ90_09790 [Spirochaetota bacterium]